MAYITEAELITEGITLATGDPRRIIPQAQAQIERITSRIFEPRAMTFSLDGSGTSIMRFGLPIIAITAVNEDGTLIDATNYSVYNRHLAGLTVPDDRDDPRLECIYSESTRPTWYEGTRNYEVTGTFGYTDYDGHSDLTLPYMTQTHNFTVGQVVTGATSGATGTIAADVDAGTTGTLTLTGVTGHFANAETITDPLGGSAKANITTHWQGVTPLAVKTATVLYVKKLMLLKGSALFSAAYLRDAEEGDTKALPYTITGDRMIDELLAPYMAPPSMGYA